MSPLLALARNCVERDHIVPAQRSMPIGADWLVVPCSAVPFQGGGAEPLFQSGHNHRSTCAIASRCSARVRLLFMLAAWEQTDGWR